MKPAGGDNTPSAFEIQPAAAAWVARGLDSLLLDVRFGWRGILRHPLHALVIVITLGLSIGANTAVFSLVRGILLRPLPYAEGERIVQLAGQPNPALSVPDIEDYRSRSRSLERVVEYGAMSFLIAQDPGSVRVSAARVSADFFDVFAVRPVLGRTFLAGEDRPGAGPVVVLSNACWQREFAASPDVVGRVLSLNEQPHVIIGVLPPLPFPAEDLVVPFTSSSFRMENRDRREDTTSLAFGRLKAQTPLAAAERDLASVFEQLRHDHPEAHATGGSEGISVIPMRTILAGDAAAPLLLLQGATALLLLLAGASVGNLTLARLADRERELAVRRALGADRGRQLRQLLAESLLLSTLGGGVAVCFAIVGHAMLVQFASRFTPRAAEVGFDAGVFWFGLGTSALVGLAVGSIRAISADAAPGLLLGGGERLTGSRQQQHLRLALIGCQVALSFVLLAGAFLLLRSAATLNAVDAGYRSEGVLGATVRFDASTRERRGEVCRAFQDDLLAQARVLPGVVAAAHAAVIPLSTGRASQGQPFRLEGQSAPPGGVRTAEAFMISTGYFEALGIPLVAGRYPREDDTPALRVSAAAFVNRRFVQRYFPTASPLGTRISFDDGQSWQTIAGVVGDVRQSALDQSAEPIAYLPRQCAQFPWALLVRTSSAPRGLVPALQTLVHRLDAKTTLSDVVTLDEARAAVTAPPRLIATLLGLLALIATLISAAGVAGIFAGALVARERECAIRIALGATPRTILRQLLVPGLAVVCAGTLAGLLGARALTPLLASQLYSIDAADPLSFTAAAAVLLGAAAMAVAVSARRALRISPATALHSE